MDMKPLFTGETWQIIVCACTYKVCGVYVFHLGSSL